MTATMSNEQMANIIEMSAALTEKGKLGYAIARNIRRLKDAAKEYLDIKAEAFKKYGETIPLGNGKTMTSVPKESMEDFQAELAETKNIEHDVEIYQIDEDTFFGGGLTSAQMEALLFMAKDEESEDK